MDKRDCYLGFLRVLVVITLVALFGYGIWSIAAYSWDNPRFQINSTFSSEPAEFINNSTVLRWDISLWVRNPNRHISFYYDKSEVLVYCDGVLLPVKSIPPFHQRTKNTTLLHVNVSKLVTQELARSLLFDKVQSYDVKLKTVFTTDDPANYGHEYNLLVYCESLRNDDTHGGEMKQCRASTYGNPEQADLLP